MFPSASYTNCKSWSVFFTERSLFVLYSARSSCADLSA